MIGTGHSLVPPQFGALIVTPDAQPGDTGTTATLTVNAAPLADQVVEAAGGGIDRVASTSHCTLTAATASRTRSTATPKRTA